MYTNLIEAMMQLQVISSQYNICIISTILSCCFFVFFNIDANQGGDNTQQPDNLDTARVIIPAVIAAVLFVALVLAMVVSVIFLVLVRQKQKKSLQHSNVNYKNLQEEDLQQKEIDE